VRRLHAYGWLRLPLPEPPELEGPLPAWRSDWVPLSGRGAVVPGLAGVPGLVVVPPTDGAAGVPGLEGVPPTDGAPAGRGVGRSEGVPGVGWGVVDVPVPVPKPVPGLDTGAGREVGVLVGVPLGAEAPGPA